MTFMLPLETMLVCWPPLPIPINSLNQIIMILTLNIPSWLTNLVVAIREEDTAPGSIIIKHKKRDYIAPRVQLKRGFINFMKILYWVHSEGLALLNITSVYSLVQLIDVFASCISITSLVELVFEPVLLLLSLSHTVPILLYDIIETLNFIVVIVYFNACGDRLYIQLWCTAYLHTYNRLLNKGTIWCKKITPTFPPRINYF